MMAQRTGGAGGTPFALWTWEIFLSFLGTTPSAPCAASVRPWGAPFGLHLGSSSSSTLVCARQPHLPTQQVHNSIALAGWLGQKAHDMERVRGSHGGGGKGILHFTHGAQGIPCDLMGRQGMPGRFAVEWEGWPLSSARAEWDRSEPAKLEIRGGLAFNAFLCLGMSVARRRVGEWWASMSLQATQTSISPKIDLKSSESLASWDRWYAWRDIYGQLQYAQQISEIERDVFVPRLPRD